MEKVLVTGATGFIGRHTLPFLKSSALDVHCIFAQTPLDAEASVTWHKADLLDPDSVYKVLYEVRPTHLLHLAWYVNPEDYRTSAENTRWKEASLLLLKAFQEQGGTRALLAGSAMEYDPNNIVERLNEYTSPVEPVTEYGKAKHALHIAAEEFAKTSGLSLAWGRIFNLYGPFEARGRFVSNLIYSLLREERPYVKAGELIYDYSYVLDIAGALVALLESDAVGAVNIASGKPVTLMEIAHVAAGILGRENLIEISAEKPEKSFRSVADITRLSDEVGFRPHYDLTEGLTETIAWWKNATR